MKKVISTQHHRQQQQQMQPSKKPAADQSSHQIQQVAISIAASPKKSKGAQAMAIAMNQAARHGSIASSLGSTGNIQNSLQAKKQSRQFNQQQVQESLAAGKKDRDGKQQADAEEPGSQNRATITDSTQKRKVNRAKPDESSGQNIQKPSTAISISSQNANSGISINNFQALGKKSKIIQSVYEQKQKSSRRFQPIMESSAEKRLKKTKSLTKVGSNSNSELRSNKILEKSIDNRSFNQKNKVRPIQIPQQIDTNGKAKNPPLTHRAVPRQKIVNDESGGRGKALFSIKNNKHSQSNEGRKQQIDYNPIKMPQAFQNNPVYDQAREDDGKNGPQTFQDRIRYSNVSNGGAIGAGLTSKAGDITINDGEEEEKQFANIKQIESSRVFHRNMTSGQREVEKESSLKFNEYQQQAMLSKGFQSLTPKNRKQTPSDGGSISHSDKTPLLTDEVENSNQASGMRNNFTFEPSIVLEAKKRAKNNNKRAFESLKLNPMSPTSQVLTPRNQGPSPLPITPTSPISPSCNNDYDEINKNQIEIKSLNLDTNNYHHSKQGMSSRAARPDTQNQPPKLSSHISNHLRIDIDQLSDVPMHPIFYYQNNKNNPNTSKHGGNTQKIPISSGVGGLSQTMRSLDKNKVGINLASYPSNQHNSNNYDNALKALESLKQHSTNQSIKNPKKPSLGEITPERSSSSVFQGVHAKRATTLAQIKSQATLHQHQEAMAVAKNNLMVGGPADKSDVDSGLGKKRMLAGISKLIEEPPKIFKNTKITESATQKQTQLQDRPKPSDLQQSESPALRMARKYQDNQKKLNKDDFAIADENSDGDLIAVNDEMRISEEDFEINTDQLKRAIHQKDESEEGEVPETARSLSPRNFMIEKSSQQQINRVKQRRALNQVSNNMSNTQNLYLGEKASPDRQATNLHQLQHSLFMKNQKRVHEGNKQNTYRAYDDAGQDLQEIVSNDSDQIVTQKNEPLQAQHYFSNQTRPSITSQDNQRATVLRQVSLSNNILNNRFNGDKGLDQMKKSLSNTCSQLNMNLVSPKSNDYSAAGGLAFHGYVGMQHNENTISDRKKLLSSSRSIQSLITNQLRDTQLLNNQSNQIRLGSTQKNSELFGTQNTNQRDQIQLVGPAELMLCRADLTHLQLYRLNYKLKQIDISNNRLRYLPTEILLLSNLVSLNLKGNFLEELPNDIPCKFDKNGKPFNNSPNIRKANTMSWSNLSNLEELNVSENKLKRLPDNIGACQNLKSLSIIANKICEIPVSLANLTNLENLHFEWFMYLDPPQQQHQKKDHGHFVIQQLLNFCSTRLTVTDYPGQKSQHPTQLSFSSYLCYFHICNKQNKTNLTLKEISRCFNQRLRFSVKNRCLIQTTICNRHSHLLQHLVLATRARSEYKPSDDMSLHFDNPHKMLHDDDHSEFLSSTRSINNMYLQGQIELDAREKQQLSTQSVRNINKLINFLDQEMADIDESKHFCHIARAVNMVIDLNINDQSHQTPFLSSLRQMDNVYANILIDIVEKAKSMQLVRHFDLSKKYEQLQQLESCPRWTTKLPDLNISCPKNGFPIHISIVGHKFDVTLRLLHLGKESINQIIDLDDGIEPLDRMDVDVKVTNSIGANVLHLLFVKYEKDFKLSKKILYEIVKMRDMINLNLIDQLQACPLHVAMRKRQFEAISECVKINRSHNSALFNFNIRNKRGQTPLHYAIEKQDHDLLCVLLRDKFIDPLTIDFEFFVKPRRKTVIFSAFHKLLYQKEKLMTRRAFYLNFYQNYVDFNGLKAYKQKHGLKKYEKELFKQPMNYEKQRAKTVRPKKGEAIKQENCDMYSKYFESMACLNILNRVNHKFDVQSRPLERMFLKNIQFDMSSGPNHRRSMDSKIKPKHLGSRTKSRSSNRNQDGPAAGNTPSQSYHLSQVFERYQHIEDPNKFYENFNEESDFVSHQLFNFRALRKLQNEKTMRIQQQYINMGNLNLQKQSEQFMGYQMPSSMQPPTTMKITSRSSSQSQYMKNNLSKTAKKSLRSHQNEIHHLEQKQRLERQMKLLQEHKTPPMRDSDYVNVGAQPKSTLNYLKYKQAVAASQVAQKSCTFNSDGQSASKQQKQQYHQSGEKSFDQAKQAMTKGGHARGTLPNSTTNAANSHQRSTQNGDASKQKRIDHYDPKHRRSNSKTVQNVSQRRLKNDKSLAQRQQQQNQLIDSKGQMQKYPTDKQQSSSSNQLGQQQKLQAMVPTLQQSGKKNRTRHHQQNLIHGQHNIISQNAKQPKPGNLMMNMSSSGAVQMTAGSLGGGAQRQSAMSDLQETQRAFAGSPEKSSKMMRQDASNNFSNSKFANSAFKDSNTKSIKKRYTIGTNKNSLSTLQRMSINNKNDQINSVQGAPSSNTVLPRHQSDIQTFCNQSGNSFNTDSAAISPFSLNPNFNNRNKQYEQMENALKRKVSGQEATLRKLSDSNSNQQAAIINNIVSQQINKADVSNQIKNEKFGPKMPRNKFIISTEANNQDHHKALNKYNNQSSGVLDIETFRTIQQIEQDAAIAANDPELSHQAQAQSNSSIRQNLIIHNRILSQQINREFNDNENQQLQMLDETSSEISAHDELQLVKNVSSEKFGKIRSKIKQIAQSDEPGQASTHRVSNKSKKMVQGVKKPSYKLQKMQSLGNNIISQEEPPCKPKASSPNHKISTRNQFPISARQSHQPPISDSPDASNPYDGGAHNPSIGGTSNSAAGSGNTQVNHQIIINNMQNIFVNMNCPVINYNNFYITQITMDGQQKGNGMGQQSNDDQQQTQRSDFQAAQGKSMRSYQNAAQGFDQMMQPQNNVGRNQNHQQFNMVSQQQNQGSQNLNDLQINDYRFQQPQQNVINESTSKNATPRNQDGLATAGNMRRHVVKKAIGGATGVAVGQNQHPSKNIMSYSPISSVVTQKNNNEVNSIGNGLVNEGENSNNDDSPIQQMRAFQYE